MAGYSQNDAAWAGDLLGKSNYWRIGTVNGETGRAAGCLLTAGCDVLNAFGHDINPHDLNLLATSQGLIDANGDVTRWDWLEVLFPHVCKFVEHKDWGNSAADLSYFDIKNDLNTEIIAMIDDSPASGLETHFMRVVGWDGGSDVIVDDSWDAVRKGISAYGNRWSPPVHAAAIIYNATKYVKVQPPVLNPNISLNQLTQVYQDLLHRAPDQGGIDHYVGHFTYDFVVNDIKNSAEYKAINTPVPAPAPTPAPTPAPAPVPVVQPPVVVPAPPTPPVPAPVQQSEAPNLPPLPTTPDTTAYSFVQVIWNKIVKILKHLRITKG